MERCKKHGFDPVQFAEKRSVLHCKHDPIFHKQYVEQSSIGGVFELERDQKHRFQLMERFAVYAGVVKLVAYRFKPRLGIAVGHFKYVVFPHKLGKQCGKQSH